MCLMPEKVALGPLPRTWDTWVEFQAPGFSQAKLLWLFGKWTAVGGYLSLLLSLPFLSLSFSLSVFLSVSVCVYLPLFQINKPFKQTKRKVQKKDTSLECAFGYVGRRWERACTGGESCQKRTQSHGVRKANGLIILFGNKEINGFNWYVHGKPSRFKNMHMRDWCLDLPYGVIL